MSDWERDLDARAAASAKSAPKTEIKDPLLQVGTRFDHYTELIDKYLLAIQRIKATYERFPNASDYRKWAEYEAFVRIMREELDKLANIDQKQWSLGQEVDVLSREARKAITPEIKKTVQAEAEALRKKYGKGWERKPVAGRSDDDSEEDDEPGFAKA